jgi:tetratricopeptide (TPR) repeat protein
MSEPSETQKPSIRWRKWLPRIAAAILVPCLVLGLTEAGLRLAGVGYSTDLLVPCTIQGKPGFSYNLFFLAPFFPPGMIREPAAYAIPAQKPPRTYRIFVLGESAAMGDPDPAYSFSRYLEVMLRDRYPSMNFEVINTGSVAINSHILLPIAEGLVKHQPDLFIIYSGNNEVVGPYGPGTALSAAGMNLDFIRASMMLRSTRIGQLFTKLGTHKREWRGMEMFLDKQIRSDSPLMRQAYKNYERNLQDTVDVIRKSGARVLLSTVVTNLKDCAPFGSLHRKGLGAEQLREWSALVQKGIQLEDAKSYPEALKAYEAAAAIDDSYAELDFRIASCLLRIGDDAEARKDFERARDLDTLRFRADSEINRINRSVASSTPGVELVDTEETLSRQSPHGVTGNEMVYEHVHLTPLGNYLAARGLFEQVVSKLGSPEAGSSAGDGVLSEEECERRLALTPHDKIRLAREMLKTVEKPPFTNQLTHKEQILHLSMDAGVPDEDPQTTASEYQWAISHWPDDKLLRYKFGLFLLRYDPNAAVQQLRQARPFDGFPIFLPNGAVL